MIHNYEFHIVSSSGSLAFKLASSVGRPPLCGGYFFDLKSKVVTHKKTSHLSTLAFFNYAFRTHRTLNDLRHKVRVHSADVQSMLYT